MLKCGQSISQWDFRIKWRKKVNMSRTDGTNTTRRAARLPREVTMQQRLWFVAALVGLVATAGFLPAQETPSRPKASLGVMVGPAAPSGEQGGVAVLQV